jgi:hypothetical protein
MNVTERKVWQQASGEPPRNYADLCLRLGVILNGYDEVDVKDVFFENQFMAETMGSAFGEGSEEWIKRLASTKKRKDDLKRFCHEMKEGDIVVLRRGTSEVFGVGFIVGQFLWNDQFGDVDGWHIPLVRRVRWFWKANPEPKRFSNWALKQGLTTQLLKRNGAVWNWLKKLDEPFPDNAALPVLAQPHSQKHLTIPEISEYLFDQGVASTAIRHLVEEIGELERIAKWYQRATQDPPSEHETVAYLVIPLLKALGWTPQRMAVEWSHIDIALFDKLPRSDDTLRIVVEAKKMNAACLVADAQAKGYAKGHCDRLIVTDGLRYGVLIPKHNIGFQLEAYLNLTRMRDSYPMLGYAGAQEALRLMTPEFAG